MRAQKMRGEVAKKERDEYFNTIRPVIPKKQEWRVKEKVHAPAPTTSDNDMDLLDDDEALLIKDGSPPLADMDINMLFTLLAKFRGVEEKVAQMCLNPKEAMFKMREESSQHLMPLYIRGHINKKLISRMLIDGSTAINLMSYIMFKKLGRGGGATRCRPKALSPWRSQWGENHSLPHSSSSRCKVTIALFSVVIRFMPTAAFLPLCINS
jgi:hypothetical protein